MGLFDRKICCMCGGKAGMILREKLADGNYICGDCVGKGSPDMPRDSYRRMLPNDVQAHWDYVRENATLYMERFRATRSVKTGLFGGKDLILIDDNNGWWVKASSTLPDIFTFDQIISTELKLSTTYRSNDEPPRRPVMPPYAGMPVPAPNEDISRMDLRVLLNHPWIGYVDLPVMDALIVSEGDIRAGYETAYEADCVLRSPVVRPAYTAAQSAQTQPAGAQVTDMAAAADAVKKLKELLDMGIISPEEFDTKKKQLLGL